MMERLIQTLSQINWDFSDYSSTKYPIDINSIPWYPATFPAPVPKFLIALLTNSGDVVLDPFGGKGTTCVEALKQNRFFYYNDLNPFATDITSSIIRAIRCSSIDRSLLSKIHDTNTVILQLKSETCKFDIVVEKETSQEDLLKYYPENIKECLVNLNVSCEALFWYHPDTLIELLGVLELISLDNADNSDLYVIKKFAFISILKEVCSQRGHFTYITDNCRPKKLIYCNVVLAYLSMLERIELSINELLKQDSILAQRESLAHIIDNSYIHMGDARKLEWIVNESIDLVITSPPYLCAQDYIKTMRLNNLFFQNKGFYELPAKEIGTRSQRRGKSDKIITGFYCDMEIVFSEIYRVLKPHKFFCLIFGQGKGKITQGYDTINDLTNLVVNNGFNIFFRTRRKISHKFVRIGGVDTEDIIIFQKQ